MLILLKIISQIFNSSKLLIDINDVIDPRILKNNIRE
jgi:hypothetical protein